MDDLISRQAVLESIENLCCDRNENWIGNDNQSFVDRDDVIDIVCEMQPVDAVPVVHAKYGFVGPDMSVCRYDTYYGTCSACKERILYRKVHNKFCPNCGAKIDAEQSAKEQQ